MNLLHASAARKGILWLLLCLLATPSLQAQNRNNVGKRNAKGRQLTTVAAAPKPAPQPADTVAPVPVTPQTVIDEAPSLLKGLGAQLWNSFADQGGQDEIKAQARKVAQLNISDSRIKALETAYGKDAGQTQEVGRRLKDRMQLFLDSMKNVPLNKLAGGALMLATTDFCDSVQGIGKMEELSDVLNKQALDTANALSQTKRLLTFLKENPALALVLNNHPAGVKVIRNTQPQQLATSPAHVLYWSRLSTAPLQQFVPQSELPDPCNYIFLNNPETSEISVNEKDVTLAHLKGNVVDCHNTDLLNLWPMPNSVYNYANIHFYTDALSRVVKVVQPFDAEHRKKSKDHNLLKPRYFSMLREAAPGTEPYYLAQRTYMGPEALINVVFIDKSDANKTALTLLKNLIKDYRDFAGAVLTTTLTYSDSGQQPSEISITVGTHKEPVVLKSNSKL